MIKSAFAHVDTWVFDLDNTLYPPTDRLFDQIEARMRDYIIRTLGVDMAEADRLRAQYWRTHGTTLAGLMHNHQIDPDPFLVEVHEVDMSHMRPDPGLAQAIANLPGRKLVYTNGSRPYAKRVLAARGLTGLFHDIYGIEHAGYAPKPQAAAFDTVFNLAKVTPTQAAMFEDDARNLMVPHSLGLRTIHVAPHPAPQPHIHYHTDDLAGFLSQVTDTPPRATSTA